MSGFETFLAGLGLNKVSAIAGGLGAGIAALKSDASRTTKGLNFIAGFCCAAWGSTVTIRAFELPNEPAYIGAIGFALGYLGMSVMEAAVVAATALKSIDWKAVIQKALGKVGL